ncbi:outer membrane protein [Bacteroides reticulotermitis JCM 10512]|uniref:Outer membrane protein n=1 Tax=Bacteroides reticulotermitis JCM 10512 TaxID=1445607 RepID=W4ULL2_9BACE|nr:outer membrane protein [Bacteroides reticulotermitis JCM 10512]
MDAFEMKSTGEPFDWNNPVHRANPYNDRDPRLEQTVFYNGMKWRSETVDTYEGGKDITMENNGIKTVTGYYMRKFLPNDQGQKGSAFPSCNPVWNYIRLADVYLMYAEAINEAQDSKTNRDLAKTYVDLVRKRVSMPVLKDDLNQAQMREAIQHERRVELAFEEQRYFDIRRWKIAHKVYGSTDQSVKLHGVTITRDAGSNFVYTLKVVATPYFDNNSMNLYPFKRDEILTNGNLEQNPGY